MEDQKYGIYIHLQSLDGLPQSWTKVGETDNINYVGKLAEGYARITKNDMVTYDIEQGKQMMVVKDGKKFVHHMTKSVTEMSYIFKQLNGIKETIEDQKVKFVNDILDSIKETIVEKINSKKVPEHWNGVQLRQYIADIVKEQVLYIPMERKAMKEYENDCLINNL